MMDTNIDVYLEKVSKALHIPEMDKNDVISEIKSHIYEALNRQEPLETVLKNLGEPYRLAKSYNHSYQLENGEFKFSDIFNNIAFYSSVALSGMFVVTILPTVTVTFALTAIFIFGLAITNMIGITNMPFNIGMMPVTGLPQVIMAAVIGIILLLVAYASWSGLKRYLKYVSTNYHKRRIG